MASITIPAFALERVSPHDTKNTFATTDQERYIAALAVENNMSYEEAALLDAQENSLISRSLDEVIQYKTVTKTAYTIRNGSGYVRDVEISAQIKYLYNKALKKAVSIEGIAAGYVSIPGRSVLTLSHGDLAYEHTSTKATITVIGALQYEDPGMDISVGLDVISFSSTVGQATVTTRTITMKALFLLADC